MVVEYSVIGDVDGAVAEVLADHRLAIHILRHGVREEYIPVGSSRSRRPLPIGPNVDCFGG